MSSKIFKWMAVILLVTLFAGCAAPTQVEPQVVEKTVVVKETVVAKETVVQKETVKETVVVAAPTEAAALSEVQELRVIETVRFHAAANMSPASEFSWGSTGLLWLNLIGTDPDAKPVPTGLASSWDLAPDYKSVVLHLRKDAKFSDGTPIMAKEVAWSLNHYAMTAHPDLYGKHDFFWAKRNLSNIKGMADIIAGKIKADEFGAADLPGIKVVDDATVEIDLENADPYIMNNLAGARVLKPDSVLAGKGKNYAEDAYWPTEPGTVFSGPWILQSFTPGSGMTLVPNPKWTGDAPTLKKINVIFVQDLTAAVAAFENKEADWVNIRMTPLDTANLQNSDYLKSSLVSYPSLSVNQLFITPFKPMDDVNVRRAVSMAIDRKALADILGGGEGQTTYQVLTGHFAPANANCAEQFAKVQGMPYDPAKAKEELAKSPYAADIANTQLNIQLGMFGMPMSQDLIIAQVVQKMLADNLGIKVVIHQDPVADFNAPPFATHLWPNEQGDQFIDQMAFMNNLAGLNSKDPLPEESKMGMVTLPRVSDLVDLMKQASSVSDIPARCEILAKAQQVWVDQVYTIDLFTFNASVLIAPWVKGYQTLNFATITNPIMVQPGVEKLSILKH
jgi:oligopeptide transport system substrate-binding protein